MKNSLCVYAAATWVGLLAGALLPIEAAAQEAQRQLEEVIVTAQKVKQPLLDVSSSLQVLGSSTIHDADVSQISDIVMLTTGLEYEHSFGRQTTNAVIRGVSAQFLSDPTVVTFIDGFSLGFTRLVDNSLLTDLERIEVLKGPQATLYGFDALGGVINYVTKKPSQTPEALVSAEYGSYDSYKVTASASGPIAESQRLYGRLAVATRREGGTVDNLFDGAKDVNPQRDVGTRGSLRWVATDSLEFNASASYNKTDDGCGDCSHIPPGHNSDNPFSPNSSFPAIGQGLLNWNDHARTTDMSYLGSYHTTNGDVVLNTTYTQPLFTVTSITGYGYIDSALRACSCGPKVGSFVPGVPGYFVPDAIHGVSEELRVASNQQGRLTWLTGLYAYRSTTDSDLLFGSVSLGKSLGRTTNYAAFANADYALTRVFSVSAGLRYDDNKQHAFLTGSFQAPQTRDRSQTTVLPRYSVSYKPNDRTNVYATVSKGYHAGGFNSINAPSPSYDSEYVWNYEVGFKGAFWGNRVQTQVDAFYLDWTGQQINLSVQSSGVSQSFIANAGRSRIKGEEAALQWAVSERFHLDGSLTFLDAKYKSYQDTIIAPLFGVNPDLSGKTLPFAPRFTGSLSGQYVAPLSLGAGAWNVRLRADVRYSSARYFDPTDLLRADPYWLANVYAGIQNERYEIGVYADNVFDKGYLTGGFLPQAFVFPPEVVLGEPRMVGVRFSARF